MILAIDVGNTNIVIGGLQDHKIEFSARIATDHFLTSDDYAAKIRSLLEIYRVSCENIVGAILSTVVPALAPVLHTAVLRITGLDALIVSSDLVTDLVVDMDDPKRMGSDLIVDAVAAIEEYPAPMLIFDMGTATTVTAVNADGVYVGGMIISGVELSLEALSDRTAQLPHINIEAPDRMLGKNTLECMQSGVVFGSAAMIDGIIDRAEKEMNTKLTAVATGGLAQAIVPHCSREIICDPNLTLKGLGILYRKNCG